MTAIRCGMEVEPEFKVISYFNTKAFIFRLGSVVSNLSESILRDIEREIKAIEKERSASHETSRTGLQNEPTGISRTSTRSRGKQSGNRAVRHESHVFREWVDAIMDCQEDKNLKSTLTPIVSKLSDMRIVSSELDNMLYEPIKEFMMMTALLLGNIPLIYFLNRDWYHAVMHTTVGKGTLAICIIVLFVSISGVVKLSKSVEYRR